VCACSNDLNSAVEDDSTSCAVHSIGGPTKTTLAREMVELLAAVAGRTVHVVGDGAYVCTVVSGVTPLSLQSRAPAP